MILVSACLIGHDVKYNGANNKNQKLIQWIEENEVVPVCPEVLGGLSIPREPAEIVGGDGEDVLNGKASVKTKSGRDVTGLFIQGANETLQIAQRVGAKVVVLKENSPSCGSTTIYSGDFNHNKIAGIGVTVALLKRNGIEVFSEDNFFEFLEDHRD